MQTRTADPHASGLDESMKKGERVTRPPRGDHHHDHDRDGEHAQHHSHEHRGGLRGRLGGLLHSHTHASAVDAAMETSAEGIRAVKISLAALLLTFAIQAAIVVASASVALLADAVHNLSDAMTAVPLWFAFWLGRRPANRRYTYGYGRAEDLAGIFVVAMIALSSVVALYEAISRFIHPQPIQHLPLVILAGLAGFAGNELVALYRMRVGRKIGSAALVADGLHARTDGLTSLAVVAGALGVALGFQAADPAVGILIALAILWILKGAARDIYHRLMDSVDPGLVEQVERVVAGVPGIQQVQSVRLRWIGHQLRAEVELISDRELGLVDAHAISVEAHHRLLHQVPRLSEALLHTSPCDHDGSDPHLAISHHFRT